MNIENLLSEITEKAKKLKTRSERLEQENKELRNSVFTYLKELETQKNEIEFLKIDLAKNEAELKTSVDNKKLHKELDKYILLVDKCISSIDIKLD